MMTKFLTHHVLGVEAFGPKVNVTLDAVGSVANCWILEVSSRGMTAQESRVHDVMTRTHAEIPQFELLHA